MSSYLLCVKPWLTLHGGFEVTPHQVKPHARAGVPSHSKFQLSDLHSSHDSTVRRVLAPQVEARAEGSVDKNVYWQYLSAWSPFFIIPIGMLAAGIIERSLQVRMVSVLRTSSL